MYDKEIAYGYRKMQVHPEDFEEKLIDITKGRKLEIRKWYT